MHGLYLDEYGNVDHALEVDMFMNNIDERLARANEKRLAKMNDNLKRINQ